MNTVRLPIKTQLGFPSPSLSPFLLCDKNAFRKGVRKVRPSPVSGESPQFGALASFHGVSPPSAGDFKWPTWCHWARIWEKTGTLSSCKSVPSGCCTPLVQTLSYDNKWPNNVRVSTDPLAKQILFFLWSFVSSVLWIAWSYGWGISTVLTHRTLSLFLHPSETL